MIESHDDAIDHYSTNKVGTQMIKMGYADGKVEEEKISLQLGFDNGFKKGFKDGKLCGKLYGLLRVEMKLNSVRYQNQATDFDRVEKILLVEFVKKEVRINKDKINELLEELRVIIERILPKGMNLLNEIKINFLENQHLNNN